MHPPPAGRRRWLSAASPPAAEVRIDENAASWSAPLLTDVLTVESQGEDLEVAALGVTLACLALLDEHTVPGWLPALLDEHHVPLSRLMPPTPSFFFTEDHGAVPFGVVRSTPDATRLILAGTHCPPNLQLALHPIRPQTATRRCTNTSCSSSSVCA